MPLPLLPFAKLITSRQLVPGSIINDLVNMLSSGVSGLTATVAGTAANSLQLNNAYNEVTTVANANDSVVLPPAKLGLIICVTNSGANSLRIFSAGTDTVQGGANVNLAAAASAGYVCTKNGVWLRFVFS